MQGQLDQESSVCESRLIDMILYFVLCSSSWTSYHSPILIIFLCPVLSVLLYLLCPFTKESVASRSWSLFTHQRLQFLSSVVFFLPAILFISSPPSDWALWFVFGHPISASSTTSRPPGRFLPNPCFRLKFSSGHYLSFLSLCIFFPHFGRKIVILCIVDRSLQWTMPKLLNLDSWSL